MPLTSAFAQDLEPIAATLAQEAVICAALASEQDGCWEEGSERLVAFSYASGISQLLHCQRALLLEILDPAPIYQPAVQTIN